MRKLVGVALLVAGLVGGYAAGYARGNDGAVCHAVQEDDPVTDCDYHSGAYWPKGSPEYHPGRVGR